LQKNKPKLKLKLRFEAEAEAEAKAAALKATKEKRWMIIGGVAVVVVTIFLN
jgi:hypothetical protein